MHRDTRLTSGAEKRNGENVLLIKRLCFLSNINDSVKGFTHNSSYSEFIRGTAHRIVINNFSLLLAATPFSLSIDGCTTPAVASACVSLTYTNTVSLRACVCFVFVQLWLIFHFSL